MMQPGNGQPDSAKPRNGNGNGNGHGRVPVIAARDVTIAYGDKPAVKSVNLEVHENEVLAIIGPSGCGKSTLLRSINRMNDSIPGISTTGQLLYHGLDLYDPEVDPAEVRRRIGMVFQKPNPFPKSIFDNVAWGPVINGFLKTNSRRALRELVERSLEQAGLLDEVKDRLDAPGLALSGGQQQRLCIARALANEPEILLMDEPCSALDPISTARIEELMIELRARYTIIIVTHNLQQAGRISDYTAFLVSGDLIEWGPTVQIFSNPHHPKTEEYVTGRFG